MISNRLGFAVKVLGAELPSHDTRRWQSGPHLRVSLQRVDAILDSLAGREIRMYRISSDLARYLTHPDLPQFHTQIEEGSAELEATGARARDMGLRLSFHPSQYILLNAADESIAEKSVRDLQAQATMLDRMGLGPESVVVTHVGGVYGDKARRGRRCARSAATMSRAASAWRRRRRRCGRRTAIMSIPSSSSGSRGYWENGRRT